MKKVNIEFEKEEDYSEFSNIFLQSKKLGNNFKVEPNDEGLVVKVENLK